MSKEELKKYYDAISDSWNMFQRFSGLENTEQYFDMLAAESKNINKKHGNTEFSREVILTFQNELDRLCKLKE